MRFFPAALLSAAFSLALLACAPSDDGPEFEITLMDYAINNSVPGFLSNGSVCSIYVRADFEGDLKASDIKMVYLRAPDGTWWDFDEADGSYSIDTFNAERKYINSAYLYDSDHPYTYQLGTYTFEIELKNGTTVSKAFEVVGPDDVAGSYVYSEDYTGATGTGYLPALRRAYGISAVRTGSSLQVSYQVDDIHATNGYLWFYDAAGEFIASTNYFYTSPDANRPFYDPPTKTATVDGIDDLSNAAAGFDLASIAGVRIVLVNALYGASGGFAYYHRSISQKGVVISN
ncbi:MAG: hypothetical protein A2Z99_12980 [Treponema sp. GWB1_62_6]|nr:MAG: hypothetical protein A2001_01690 [Treponema sp. GWC1_61_84]OHE65687.1 MAG: hypothetical protein A2Y36_01535 [Treponema sp. GWA1_62_8]OHE67112.1 MAG: hypothetical protein A2Z99_12980 [Treponema sp. GWB1_62_6]OHE77060.1 MAG: hypothetical protein A2413_08110 [Treponema sp. RIFOXYC1_FULL_61_9]HCM25221.1 hypothetical protein [Treponema sp.]